MNKIQSIHISRILDKPSVNEKQIEKLLNLMDGDINHVEKVCNLLNEFGYEKIKQELFNKGYL